ncbi:MAG: hypothetical protein Q7K45_05190 [Nanoarchaeota archaeon]|nr:hypothetical protein [Nanoarchaeota archaeon]
MPTSLPEQYYSKRAARGINQSMVGGLCLAGGGFLLSDIVMGYIAFYEKKGIDLDFLSATPALLISGYTIYVGGYYLYEGIHKIRDSRNDSR